MNWLSNFARPGVRGAKPDEARETPDNLWIKCPLSGDLIFRAELEAADWVTPAGFHMRIGPEPRFKHLFDEQAWQKIALPKVTADPLKFKDDKKYVDRLKAAPRRKVVELMVAALEHRSPIQPPTKLITPRNMSGRSPAYAVARMPPRDWPPISMRVVTTSDRVRTCSITASKSAIALETPARDSSV